MNYEPPPLRRERNCVA